MEKERRLRKPDSYESSARLMWGFVGALVVAVTGKVFRGSGDSGIWITATLAVLIWTGYGQGFVASAYNGFVSGLFYNFFFISQDGQLSFDSSGDWWLELTFVVVGIIAGLLGRWRPTTSGEPQQESAPEPRNRGTDFVWDSIAARDQRGKKEKTWTW